MDDTDQSSQAARPQSGPAEEDVYSIEAVVHITRTPRHQIAVYCRHGLISTVAVPEREGWWFDGEAVRELRRIECLRIDYGMNIDGLHVVSELFREVERLREEVRALRR
jgi:DNA-binding transcriptional MerR regulator